MFEAAPKISSVDGETIREKIRRHITQLKAALSTFDDAILKRREGYDWHCIKEELEDRRRASELVLPAIADGIHVMSMDQWLSVCNRFADVRNADEVLAHQKSQKEHRAAHTAPAGAPQ